MAGTAKVVWDLAVKYGPKLGAALAVLWTFLKENPNIPTWLSKQLREIAERTKVLSKRGHAARIRGTLDIIRDVAREVDAHDGEAPGTDIGTWVSHADSIGHRVRLAEALPKPQRKETLARLLTESEALLADLISALTSIRSAPATALPEDEPGTS